MQNIGAALTRAIPDQWNAKPMREQGIDGDDVKPDPKARPNETLQGMRFGLTYRDARNDLTERTVRVDSIYEDSGFYYLSGFCEMRGGERSFRLDRMVSAVDLATGEVLDDPMAHFTRFATAKDGTSLDGGDVEALAVLARVRLEALLLCHVARADNRYTAEERDIILRFMVVRALEHGLALPAASLIYLQKWLLYQSPSVKLVEEAVASLQAKPPETLSFFWQTATAVAFSDSVVDASEFRVLDRINQAIRGKPIAKKAGSIPPKPTPKAQKPVSKSGWVAVQSFMIGGLFTYGLYWLIPTMSTWVYIAFNLFCTATAFPQLLQMTANEKIIDRNDRP